ncbi:MAG: 1,4-alpha-glucan branching protein, partial [Elusimicrobiota bacterium]|nr:1,4-alpha-glucan branching protein [Elusimicrobiota bacterium]
MKNASGNFCFVLHSHLPYVKKAGVWPFGEEWLLEGMLETYLPLLDVLYQLRDEKIPYKIVVGITPILAEQLADDYFKKRFEEFVSDKIRRADFDIEKFTNRHQHNYKHLAELYKHSFEKILDNFRNKYNRNIIAAFKKLQDEGYVEIITSAATHGYLPLLSRDSSIYAQLKIGIDIYEKHFGRKPKGIWLPECAYRPEKFVKITKNESYRRPPIDEFLAVEGVEYFIVDGHAITGGQAFAGWKRNGAYDDIKSPVVDYSKKTSKTTMFPYLTKSGVVAFGRNFETGLQVWSGEHGYPADGNYREFHKKDCDSGLQYWKITSTKIDLGLKEIYNPGNVSSRINENTDHFNWLVESTLSVFSSDSGNEGIVVAPYDTELLGHWWFEGIEWLRQVLIKISKNPNVEITMLSEYLKNHPPKYVAEIPESSWGDGGGHYVWLNSNTNWLWTYIHDAEVQMEDIAG